MLKVRLAHYRRFLSGCCNRRCQIDVEIVLVVVLEVWQRLGLLLLVWDQKLLECIHGHDPRGNRSSEAGWRRRIS